MFVCVALSFVSLFFLDVEPQELTFDLDNK